ncbi:MAG: hypothetical protein RLZZ417_598 [Bacteroidota bacterium]|jgi:hypothetical protein
MYVKYLTGNLFMLFLFLAGWIPAQSDFLSLMTWLVPANICYFLLLYFSKNEDNLLFYFLIAVAIRGIFIFSTPHLSDDYFRFIWDGHISLKGENPYEKTPMEYVSTAETMGDLYSFAHLNSPRYHSVYPPFLQYIFKFSAFFGEDKPDVQIFVLKLFYAFFSIGMVFLLPQLLKLYHIKSWQALIYLLNPLVLLEEMGNLHAEGIMVFFLSLFLFAIKKFPHYAFLPFATTIIVKLTPLLLIPSILLRLSLKRALFFGSGILMVLILFFLPFLQGICNGGFFESLGLYFNKLEMNAYGYNIFKFLGYLTHGYNLIKILGPLTAVISTLMIVYFSFKKGRIYWDSFPLHALSLYFIYLFFSPVVHPWYLIPLLFFTTFHPLKFVIVWSVLVLLSYSHYQYGINKENYTLVFIEYLTVTIFLIIDLHQFFSKREET